MTDERVEPTKEWLDALIDEIIPPNFPTTEAQRWAMRKLRDAILASQPERVECPTMTIYRRADGEPIYGEYDFVTQTEWFEDIDEPVELIMEDWSLTGSKLVTLYPALWTYEPCPNCGEETKGCVTCPDCGQSLKGAGE